MRLAMAVTVAVLVVPAGRVAPAYALERNERASVSIGASDAVRPGVVLQADPQSDGTAGFIVLGALLLVGLVIGGRIYLFIRNLRSGSAPSGPPRIPPSIPQPPFAPAGAGPTPGPFSTPPSVAWVPTHTVPMTGSPTWSTPDPATAPTATLQPGLQVRLLEVRGAWALVGAVNGWSGWVDGRSLVPPTA